MKKKLVILGSTGSIGQNTLTVVRNFPDQFQILGLAAGRNIGLLAKQIEEFNPRLVTVEKKIDAQRLSREISRRNIKILYGDQGYQEIASMGQADLVISAITGIAGLKPTLAALEAGKNLALANKESMVVAGALIRKVASQTGARIIPIDSEHSGIFQCLSGQKKKYVKRIFLTASGGPFFRVPLANLADKTCEEALQHPRWKMGQKITIDSATLMNKGLELIEARWLFKLEPQQLEVLIHPQSVVHALVEFIDGSVLAQMSQTDMRIPIQFALTYPDRLEGSLTPLDLIEIKDLEFYPVDSSRYPLFRLARQALEAGLSFPVVLNAANEVAVKAFLGKMIKFGQIFEVVDYCLQNHQAWPVNTLEEILAVDQKTREQAYNYFGLKGKGK
ncbi:MAG: 1-deoxy-D-xylulose-5-phosphate reductoisomerase [Candidatus Saccharicenans sp.]